MAAAPDPSDRARTFLLAPGLVALVAGCGGATPLLHPAHTLAPGKVTFGAGASGTFLAGQAKSSLDQARAVTSSGSIVTDEEKEQLTEGTITSVLATPGVAPWVGARVGIAERTDAGAAYTGTWARLDVRHALEDRKFALSFGLAGLLLLSHPSADKADPTGTSGQIAGVDANGAYGFGFHVPVLVGYRSDAELVQTWAGLVGTFEQAYGPVVIADDTPDDPNDPLDPSDEADEADLNAHRISGAVVVGLAVGIDPIWVAIELTGRYFSLDGSLRNTDMHTHGELSGLSIEPAGAVIGRF
jgi:hypothetical protein